MARNWRRRANLKKKEDRGVFFPNKERREVESACCECVFSTWQRRINKLTRERRAALKPTSLIIELTLAHASAKSRLKRWRNWSAAKPKDCVVTWITAMRHLPMDINHSFMPLCAGSDWRNKKVRWEKKNTKSRWMESLAEEKWKSCLIYDAKCKFKAPVKKNRAHSACCINADKENSRQSHWVWRDFNLANARKSSSK